jgi:hypothetical protein
MAMAILSATQKQLNATAADAALLSGQTISLAAQTQTLINGRDGGDQIIVTITQEVFRRKFNSGFQNS